ncbi:MAG TPA: hypothetical protein VKB88_15055 [Bryobacteraceae bacterium]|nr:hypothetical protein [Bryobacteraceae bacterium]
MRSWLSLFFLATALLAQVQETPLTPDNIQRMQRQTILLQTPPGEQQYYQRPKAPRKAPLNFFEPPPATVQRGPTNYWNFQVPPAPERIQVRQPTPKTPAGKPTPKPLIIPRKPLHFYVNPKICSIPLINALKGKPAHPDTIAVQPPPGHFTAEVIAPPAPPCDDWK